MKKSITTLFLFSIVLCILLCILQYGIDSYYRSRVANKFNRLIAHNVDAGIMIFGSSVAYHQLDPVVVKEVTGLQTYNMAWDGLFFVQYNGLIKEFLSYTKQAKCIVFACDFDNLGKNNLITRPDLFLAYTGNANVYHALHEIEPEKMWKARYLPGYKLTVLGTGFYRTLVFAQPDMTIDGYDVVKERDWQIQKDTVQPFNARYDEHVFSLLKGTVKEITDKGIKVVFIMTPLYDDGYKLIKNAADIKAKYASLAGPDVHFLDYSQDTLSHSKFYFINYSHLNPQGAEIFSRRIANDIRRIMSAE